MFTELRVTVLSGPGTENDNDQQLLYEIQRDTSSVDQINRNAFISGSVNRSQAETGDGYNILKGEGLGGGMIEEGTGTDYAILFYLDDGSTLPVFYKVEGILVKEPQPEPEPEPESEPEPEPEPEP